MSIYPHTVTFWKRSVEGRQAIWSAPDHLIPVRFEEVLGATPGVQGDDTKRSALLLIGGASNPLKKGDKVCKGMSNEQTPPQDAFTVETLTPISIGSTVHHWELTLS